MVVPDDYRDNINIDNKTEEYENKALDGLNRGAFALQDAEQSAKNTYDRGKDLYDRYKDIKNKREGRQNKSDKNTDNFKSKNHNSFGSKRNDKSDNFGTENKDTDNFTNNRTGSNKVKPDTNASKNTTNVGKQSGNELSKGAGKSAGNGTKTAQKGIETGAKGGAKTAETGARVGAKSSTKGAEIGAKTAANTATTGAQVATAGAQAGAQVGAQAGAATVETTAASIPVLPIILGILACILILLILFDSIKNAFFVSAVEAALIGSEQTVTENNGITSEALEIEYLFKSFTESSNDDERSKYKDIYSQICDNGYSLPLYAMWKELALDCLYSNISQAFEGQNLADMFYANSRSKTYAKKSKTGKIIYTEKPIQCESILAYTYDLYVGKFYLMMVEDEGYRQMVFSPKLYKNKNSYVVGRDDDKNKMLTEYHYHYCNNIIKMCLNSFINPKTNKVYTSVDKYLSKYKEKKKDKIEKKGLSEDEIITACRNYQIRRVIKNLEGKNGLVEKCYIRAEQVTGSKKKKIKYTYLNLYLYKNDGYGNFWLYKKDNHKFIERVYDEIIAYTEIFSSNGNAEDICAIALEQVGKKGANFWNNTKYYKGGGTEWCAIFCCWLMEQVGINPADVGWDASCSAWIGNASKKNLYHSKNNYFPKAGDFIFYDYIPGDGKIASHVGFVAGVDGTKLHTVEGNATGEVFDKSKVAEFKNKDTSLSSIVGYISMSSFYSSSSGITSNVGSGAKDLKPVVTDPNYKGSIIHLTDTQRKKIECLVSNENSVNGYVGCLLIAQCIRDAIVDNLAKPDTVKKDMGYDASDSGTPSQDAKNAVSYIFDKGGYAVKHRILYMYAPNAMKTGISVWHETQLFVVEHTNGNNPVRYFDRRAL